jgi:hypothetical protein
MEISTKKMWAALCELAIHLSLSQETTIAYYAPFIQTSYPRLANGRD